MKHNDIGLVGLAVMGQNLALNIARNGFGITVYNRTGDTTREFMTRVGEQQDIRAAYNLKEFADSLTPPRKVICMVKAGNPVDKMIEALLEVLEPGDIIMDAGNSMFLDTERRAAHVEGKGLRYMGVGVSGGEEGALRGPSIMPGGTPDTWAMVEHLFTAIAARADKEPCVAYMGTGGAGHFVKMVHNGIEYGDMQLIAEVYDLLRKVPGLSASELACVFNEWQKGPLASYLIDITADIFRKIDGDTGKPLVDLIMDTAGQKGTGRWTVQSALNLGVPVPTLAAAVDARVMSSLRDERAEAAEKLSGPASDVPDINREDFIVQLGEALYTAKISAYAQGFALLQAGDRVHGFGLDFAEVARIWKAGCIIRARFLDHVRETFVNSPGIPNLLTGPFFKKTIGERNSPSARLLPLLLCPVSVYRPCQHPWLTMTDIVPAACLLI